MPQEPVSVAFPKNYLPGTQLKITIHIVGYLLHSAEFQVECLTFQ